MFRTFWPLTATFSARLHFTHFDSKDLVTLVGVNDDHVFCLLHREDQTFRIERFREFIMAINVFVDKMLSFQHMLCFISNHIFKISF